MSGIKTRFHATGIASFLSVFLISFLLIVAPSYRCSSYRLFRGVRFGGREKLLGNQSRESGDPNKTRILKVLPRKLYAETLFDC